jgi:hypothetical protein
VSSYTDDTRGILTEQSILTKDHVKHEQALNRLRMDIDAIFRGPMQLLDD